MATTKGSKRATGRAHLNMREVARHLGVSVTTVSFVLNDRPGIAQETRERVMKAVEELGYTPSLVGKAINRKHSGVVGVVVPISSGGIFPGIVGGVNYAAEAKGMPIFVSYSQDRSYVEAKTLRMYSQLSVDGIIIATVPNTENDALLEQLHQNGAAIVQIERYRSGVSGAFVGSDNRSAAYAETKRLLAAGHKKVGCIMGAVPHSVNDEHQLGYAAALREAGIDLDPTWMRYISPRRADFTQQIDAFKQQIAAYLSDRQAPKALLWCNTGAQWLAEMMDEMKLVNGRDVDVVLFDTDPSVDLRGQRFINVVQDGERIGRAAFDLLAQQKTGQPSASSASSDEKRVEVRIPCRRMEVYGLKMLGEKAGEA